MHFLIGSVVQFVFYFTGGLTGLFCPVFFADIILTNVEKSCKIKLTNVEKESEVTEMLNEEELPDAEHAVMKVLWKAEGEMKTAEIAQRLSEEKNWSMSTIQALLARLLQRGFVSVRKEGRLKYYRPAVGQEPYNASQTKSFFKKLHDNSIKSLIASLVDSQAIGEEELAEIEEIIQSAGEKHD